MGKRYCCVDACPIRKTHDHNLSLFLLPKDPVAFKKWVTTLQPHRNSPVNKFCSVCELHFDASDIRRAYSTKLKDGSDHKFPRGRISLSPGAAPKYFGKDLRFSAAKRPRPSNKSDERHAYEFHFEESVQSEESNRNESENSERMLDDGDSTVDDDSVVVIGDQPENDEDVVEVIFKEEDDYVSDADDVCFSDPTQSENPEKNVQNRHVEPSKERTLLDILDTSSHKSTTTDVETFARLCKTYIVSNKKQGRYNFFERLPLQPLKKPHGGSQGGDEPVIYPFGKLDISTLVYNIDHVIFPSEDWFCSMRNGIPVFLCWGEKFLIKKEVAFVNERLEPKVILEGDEVVLDEVVKPRSIHEVNSILKVVDSAKKCTPKFNELGLCKGYFFTKPGAEGGNMCSNCRNASILPTEVVTTTFSFDAICDSAEYLVRGRTDWSYTRLASAIIFIGWRRSYNAEKMLIINSDLSFRILFGDIFATIDGLQELDSLDDIKYAIEQLSMSRQCCGRGGGSRAEGCVGYVLAKDRLPGRRPLQQRVRCPQCRVSKRPADTTSSANHSPTEGGWKEEGVSLVDSLGHIPLPSELWSHSVVGKTVLFQNWDETFSLIKKIVIQPDLLVQVFILDCSVEIEGITAVESLREVMRLLKIVDCIRLCDGFDGNRNKARCCAGYFYHLESARTSDNQRCGSCNEMYRILKSVQRKECSSPTNANNISECGI